MLFTKCILSDRSKADGIRISVMSRHTREDGITPDERITPDTYDEHWRDLGPSPGLIGSFYKNGRNWERFWRRYLEEIHKYPKAALVQRLAERALTEDLTILCIETLPNQCHRRLLAEACLRYQPHLKIVHQC